LTCHDGLSRFVCGLCTTLRMILACQGSYCGVGYTFYCASSSLLCYTRTTTTSPSSDDPAIQINLSPRSGRITP